MRKQLNDDIEGSENLPMTSEDERIIYFSGDVSETSVSEAISSLFTLAKRDAQKPVYIVIETYGGSVDSMNALYDAIKYVMCPVHTIGLGKIMSAGVLILSAGKKGERMIGPTARVMTHPSWTHIEGNVFEVRAELDELHRQEEQWIENMSIETGQPAHVWRELNDQRLDVYMTPQRCIELGIADRLLYDPTELIDKNKMWRSNNEQDTSAMHSKKRPNKRHSRRR